MTHIMLDIETLGKKPGCVVLSAALVRFSDLATASVVFNVHEQYAAGLVSDPGTVAWWQEQTSVAQAAVTQGARPIAAALGYIRDWLNWATTCPPATGDYGPVPRPPEIFNKPWFIWCHGAGFDAPILAEVFERFGFPVPWDFRQVRDTRTLYDLAGINLSDFSEGERHIAANDALCQTKAAVASLEILKSRYEVGK